MPHTLNYSPVIELISSPRITSFSSAFGVDSSNEFELYGVYIWAQNASASLYPLIQQLEIVLRNAIDREARRRFGDFWWDKVCVNQAKWNHKKFKRGIEQAKGKLTFRWERAERSRLGIASKANLPPSSIMPSLSHDDIVATTDFSTWEFVLVDAYSSGRAPNKNDYLWPKSMGKVFKKYSEFNNSPELARLDILNSICEVREYRNRLFHHDCIWVKSKAFDRNSAIESIRHKINLIEKLICCISPATLISLNKWGLFNNARRVCSVEELEMYVKTDHLFEFEDGEESVFGRLSSPALDGTKTVPIGIHGKTMAIYKLR